MNICKLENCDRKHEALGYCQLHYQRFKKWGDPLHSTVTFHGLRNHELYRTWYGIHRRCSDPKHKEYKNYGARGISVCERWCGVQGLKNFISDMGTRPLNHTIDRIDNDGDYSPKNCKWSTLSEQNMNRRTSNKTGFKGVSETKFGKFASYIKIDGKSKNLGTFDTPQQAHEVYLKAFEERKKTL